MRVRLIQPSQLNEEGKLTKFKKLWFPNLTLPTVAALTPEGIDVGITMEYVKDIDFDEDVDLVGITAQTCQAPRAYQIAAEFRKRGVKTVMGGIHASACPEEALGHVDAVVVGEAENQWEGVLADAKAGRLKRLYRTDVKPELTRLAIPRYDLLDYDEYVTPPFARTPLIPIQASRGCPHRCDFCSVWGLFGHKIRKKPIANVLKEIEAIRPSRIFFSDDNIGADPQYSMELFKALKPLKTRWACQMSTTIRNHPELIDAAAAAGCHETYIGMESINEENLKSVHKSHNKVADYETMFKRLADVGILAQAALVIGFDDDTPDNLLRAIDIVSKWHINYLYVAILMPLPNTVLRSRLEQEERLLDRSWSLYDLTHALHQPKRMTTDEMEEVLWQMYERFYTGRNLVARTWRFMKPYLKYFPRDNIIEETYFQLHMFGSIRKRMFPFTLGLSSNGQ